MAIPGQLEVASAAAEAAAGAAAREEAGEVAAEGTTERSQPPPQPLPPPSHWDCSLDPVPLPPLSLSLRGKVALVTGASSGIGRVFAKYLVQQGCHVAAAARRTAQLQSLAEEIRLLEGASQGQRAPDVRSREASQVPLLGGASQEQKGQRALPASGAEASQEQSAREVSQVPRCLPGQEDQGQRALHASGQGEAFGQLLPLALDVTAPEADVDAAVGRAWAHFGGINILVNNAGFRGPKAGVLDITDDDFTRTLVTNMRGPWVVTKAVVRRVASARKARGAPDGSHNSTPDQPGETVATRFGAGDGSPVVGPGASCPASPHGGKVIRGMGGKGSPDLGSVSVINISSIAGLEGGLLPGGAAYTASKGGVIRLTKAMAVELGQHGVRCNCIAPGLFESDITQGLFQQPWLLRNAQRVVPLKRWGTVHPDLTGILHFLAADFSRHTTGAVIVVDGGQNLMRMQLDPRL